MARKKNIWHPSYPVTITAASGWRESYSNPGSFYRELTIELDGVEIGRQFVDKDMRNYESGAWDLILGALDEGFVVKGLGCIYINSDGDRAMDCDHFTTTEVVSPVDTKLFV